MSASVLPPDRAAPAQPGSAGGRPVGPGEISLPAFQGPLDLLLHLIRTEALDVTVIPVAEIVRQYNEYLALVQEADPETNGDHLVGVATLIHMKSRRLLPPDPVELAAAESGSGEMTDEDHRARGEELRVAAEHLQEREAVMEMIYLRPAAAVAEYAGEQGIDADLFALLRAFREILSRTGNEASPISRERITLVERINWLMDTMQRERRIHFRVLFAGLTDRVACILTFLALLEVVRLRLVRAYTSHHQEDILIVLADGSVPSPSLEDGAADA
jgi:segregation and condensation protein A